MPLETSFEAPGDWQTVRDQFLLTRDTIELSAMYLTSHPRRVASAIEAYRQALDRSPHGYVSQNGTQLFIDLLKAVQRYFGVDPGQCAFTHSTTAGLSQIYSGIRIAPGDHIVTSDHEHFTTIDVLNLREQRDRMTRGDKDSDAPRLVRSIRLFGDSRTVTTAEIVANLTAAIQPSTRVLALTWVHSSNGVKMPVRDIARVVAVENANRPAGADRLLFVVDGVHGFGIENATFGDLDCDLFVSGCHKWLFGPRGTAVIYGKPEAWAEITPLAPSFFPKRAKRVFQFNPGGSVAYEHFWALPAAVEFAEWVGKANVEARVRALASRLKQELAAVPGVTVATPASPEFSSGIVAFDVDKLEAPAVAASLIAEPHRISATVSGADVAAAGKTHVRFSPAIFNTDEEIDRAVAAVAAIARSAS